MLVLHAASLQPHHSIWLLATQIQRYLDTTYYSFNQEKQSFVHSLESVHSTYFLCCNYSLALYAMPTLHDRVMNIPFLNSSLFGGFELVLEQEYKEHLGKDQLLLEKQMYLLGN